MVHGSTVGNLPPIQPASEDRKGQPDLPPQDALPARATVQPRGSTVLDQLPSMYGGAQTLRRQSVAPVVDDGRPTPSTYLLTNPLVPGIIKNHESNAKFVERNAYCRLVGGIGSYHAAKYRSWIMSCSAFISFACICILVAALLSCSSDPVLLIPFAWVKGQTHWKMIPPIDWTDKIFLGLSGMSNVTYTTEAYFVEFNSVGCQDVFEDACASCHTTSLWVIIFLSISAASAVLGFLLDLHRIFKYFDLNCSKVAALFTHFVVGVVSSVLAYIFYLQGCFMALPDYAVHQGQGRRGIGLYFEWELTTVALLVLILIILRIIPGIAHLLVPTPSWANNKGLKALRQSRGDRLSVMDPDPFFNDATKNDTPVKPSRIGAAPVQRTSTGKPDPTSDQDRQSTLPGPETPTTSNLTNDTDMTPQPPSLEATPPPKTAHA